MAQFQRPHPWDPGYALPNYVYGEPPGRGTLTSKGLARGTIDTASAHQTQANYAVPNYILAETPGRGARDTAMLPRRFVDTKVPDAFSRFVPRGSALGSLGGTVFGRRTLTGSSLGDVKRFRRRSARRPFALGDAESTVEYSILGVPFAVDKVGMPPQWLWVGSPSVLVPKSKVPKALAAKIASGLQKAVQAQLKANPALKSDPKKLLDAAKRAVGLVGDSDAYKKMPHLDFGKANRHLLVAIVKTISGIGVWGKYWAVQVEDVGSSYKVTLTSISDDGVFTTFANIVTYPVLVVGKIVEGGVNLTTSGVGWFLETMASIMSRACAAAQDDLANLVGDIGLRSGDTYGAGIGAAQKITASMCASQSSGGGVVSESKSMLPWIIGGAGALLIGLAVTK